MVQIIDSNQPLSTAEKFGQMFSNLGQGMGQAIPQFLMQKQQRKMMEQKAQQENETLKRLTGMDLSGLDPKMKQKAFELAMQAKNEEEKFGRENLLKRGKEEQDKKDKIVPFKEALTTIERMKSIRKKGGLGFFSHAKSIFGGEDAKDRGEYQTLGNSLISYASNIPIRNKSEFEKLAGRISDPDITDAEAEGVLTAMEKIIKGSLSQYSDEESQNQEKNPIEPTKGMIVRNKKTGQQMQFDGSSWKPV